MNTLAVLLLCIVAGAVSHLYYILRLLAWIERRSRWEHADISQHTSVASPIEPKLLVLRPASTGQPDYMTKQPAMPATAPALVRA